MVLPRKCEHSIVIVLRKAPKPGFNVLDKRGRFAALEIGNKPLVFAEPVGRAAGPDAVAADDNQVVWGRHLLAVVCWGEVGLIRVKWCEKWVLVNNMLVQG